MSAPEKPARPFRDFLRILIAPTIWFAHFSFLYAAETLICIRMAAGRSSMMGWTAGVATAAAFAGLLILAVRLVRLSKRFRYSRDETRSWILRASLMSVPLSALGIAWTIFPATVLPACAPQEARAIDRTAITARGVPQIWPN